MRSYFTIILILICSLINYAWGYKEGKKESDSKNLQKLIENQFAISQIVSQYGTKNKNIEDSEFDYHYSLELSIGPFTYPESCDYFEVQSYLNQNRMQMIRIWSKGVQPVQVNYLKDQKQ